MPLSKLMSDMIDDLAVTAAKIAAGAVTQAKMGTNVASNGPAFSAYISTASQTLTSSVFAKLLCQAEEFDTNSNYDNATNYRFTPTVAGYYQMNGSAAFSGSATYATLSVYKNGAEAKRGNAVVHPTGSSMGANVSALIYCNGTTDYLELYAYAQGTSLSVSGANAAFTYFQGSLARAA